MKWTKKRMNGRESNITNEKRTMGEKEEKRTKCSKKSG